MLALGREGSPSRPSQRLRASPPTWGAATQQQKGGPAPHGLPPLSGDWVTPPLVGWCPGLGLLPSSPTKLCKALLPLRPSPGHLPQDHGMNDGAHLGDAFPSKLWTWVGLLQTVHPPPNLSWGGAGVQRPRGGYGPTCFGIGGPADALAADEGVQRPRGLRRRAAAEPGGAARSGHPAGGPRWQGAHRAAAAAGGRRGLRAGVGHGGAERELLGGAGRAVPWLGGARRRAQPDGQQEQKRPGAGCGGLGHRGAGAAAAGGVGALASERGRARC